MYREGPEYDREVPLLIVKIGGYPLSHQGLAVARTLGRVGVPVYTVTEDRFTPQAVSRYMAGHFTLATTGAEPEEQLVGAVRDIAKRLGRRAVVLPTDDEAAILLAEHADELDEWLIQPRITPGLPRLLASKRGVHDLCTRLGVPTPEVAFPGSRDAVIEFSRGARFPIVAKNVAAWQRLRSPSVSSTTIIRSAAELEEIAAGWPDPPNVILQEYIPAEAAEDWVFHGYCGTDAECRVAFTGVKYRSWPTHAGVTTLGRAVRNGRLEEQSRDLCRRLGYRGIVDLDWRYDARDDTYKLVDFNPRTGANFRMFENAAGIDVVRALHLDLTGRTVPAGPAVDGHALMVEHLDVPSRALWRARRSAERQVPYQKGATELAWFARDDPLPLIAMALRLASPGFRLLGRTARTRAANASRRLRQVRFAGRTRPVAKPGG